MLAKEPRLPSYGRGTLGTAADACTWDTCCRRTAGELLALLPMHSLGCLLWLMHALGMLATEIQLGNSGELGILAEELWLTAPQQAS
jgi:hypothetical protein